MGRPFRGGSAERASATVRGTAAPAARPTDSGRTPPQFPTAASIGHEFNNLLGRVICLAEEIQDHDDPEQIHARAETLIEMAESGAELVRRLMTTIEGSSADVPAVELKQAPGPSWRRATAADDLKPDAPFAAPGTLRQ